MVLGLLLQLRLNDVELLPQLRLNDVESILITYLVSLLSKYVLIALTRAYHQYRAGLGRGGIIRRTTGDTETQYRDCPGPSLRVPAHAPDSE